MMAHRTELTIMSISGKKEREREGREDSVAAHNYLYKYYP